MINTGTNASLKIRVRVVLGSEQQLHQVRERLKEPEMFHVS